MIRIAHFSSPEANDFMDKIDRRGQFENSQISKTVSEILQDVKLDGNKAVVKYIGKYDSDQVDTENLRVTKDEFTEANGMVDSDFVSAINEAKKNIQRFHQRQIRQSWFTTEDSGVILGHLIRPLKRVGVCVPSVSQLLVSSLLMNVLPAKVAGVEEVVVFLGPKPDGTIDPHMLVAASICEINEVYKCGGAPAVGAMAHGTESIRAVDKIVGPGNPYVQEAKRQVMGLVDIDKIAGPSEVLVIADDQANPAYVAADMICQAEHGTDSSAILVTTCGTLAESVKNQIQIQITSLPRKNEITGSFANYGFGLLVDTIEQAIDLANRIAPEHLGLIVREPYSILGQIRNAGAIMIGEYTPESVGDYMAGPNHVLPTGGTARFASPLSVDDFVKKTSLIQYTQSALERVSQPIIKLAKTESLDGHAAAITIRDF
ncbi:histidinol dehydrogenase [Candidatus Poribacteria bacterium]|nr:histidinol dehydrogenase [Candidatus Poribacteria bacterium]OUT62438.1 MAG: histidinol dehydrogenase [bacterium TMED15]